MDTWGTFSSGGKIFFTSLPCSAGSRALTTSYPIGTGAFSLVANRTGHEGDHSLPPSAEVKNEWSYTLASPICLYDVVLNNHQGQIYDEIRANSEHCAYHMCLRYGKSPT
jgi:hypothetical protein